MAIDRHCQGSIWQHWEAWESERERDAGEGQYEQEAAVCISPVCVSRMELRGSMCCGKVVDMCVVGRGVRWQGAVRCAWLAGATGQELVSWQQHGGRCNADD